MNKISNLFSSQTQKVRNVENSSQTQNDQLHSYIVEKSKTGPHGTYIYSDPKKGVHYNFENKAVNDKLYLYISEKANYGPNGFYLYSNPKENIYFKKLKC